MIFREVGPSSGLEIHPVDFGAQGQPGQIKDLNNSLSFSCWIASLNNVKHINIKAMS